MKFKFSLEKVVKQRNIKADLAQRDFGEAQALYQQETTVLQAMIDTKNTSLSQRTELVHSTQNWTSSVEQINQFLIGQDLRIKKQNERLKEIENIVESKREILRQCMIEVKIIEKLREKKLQAFVKEQNRQEQNELDEMVSLRFATQESVLKGSHEDGI